MKHLKIYEKYISNNIFDVNKIKEYTVTTDRNKLLYYFDNILYIDKNNDTVEIKSLFMYHIDNIFNEWLDDIDKVHFSYFNNLLFTSDNYDECLSYYMNIIDIHKTANKYNL